MSPYLVGTIAALGASRLNTGGSREGTNTSCLSLLFFYNEPSSAASVSAFHFTTTHILVGLIGIPAKYNQ